ncbi:MAG: crossover junction endodeoxyribonuclease RuvC [Gammaproteobacteria bacterium]
MRVLGIDPGSLNTGLGVVEAARDELRMVACERIRNAGGSEVPARLAEIFRGVARMIELHRPDAVAIEQVFMANNARSALVLGQAGGSAICAAVVGGCAVTEYSAREIKRAVVGAGAADKRQVQHMVRVLLGLRAPPGADEADALACAICHIHSAQAAKTISAKSAAAAS